MMSRDVLHQDGWESGENFEKINEMMKQVDAESLNRHINSNKW